MMKQANQVVRCTLLTALIALGMGCSDGSGGGKGAGDDGADGGNGTEGGGQPPAAEDCEGAFATVDAPYTVNNAIEDWGGFVADEQGLVFSAIVDSTQDGYDADLPSIIAASDLSGNVETLYSVPATAMPGQIFAFGDEIYFAEGLLSRRIMKMPRAGGEATVASDDGMWTGPVRNGSKLYYFANSVDSSFVALDMASGETETLALIDDMNVVAIAIEGDTLYFAETESVFEETDYSLYSMPVAGGDPELIMQLPHDTLLGGFRVVDGVGFGSGITSGISIEIHRFEFGEDPVVVEDQGGMPMVIDGDTIYYNGSEGLETNSLEFDDPAVIARAPGGFSALALSESSVWYASGRCIYRSPR